MLFAGLLIHNITPGPFLLKDHPDVFWGVVTSMYVGNVMLLVLNLPLIRMWVQITKIPFRVLCPLIILFCLIGVYSIDSSIFDLWIMLIFGVFGYLMKKCDYEPAPLVLAYILGPMLDQAMRQSLILSEGSPVIFFSRPISGVCMAAGAFLLILSSVTYWRKKPREGP
jgi:putative tricarboxylic transport membrane protein